MRTISAAPTTRCASGFSPDHRADPDAAERSVVSAAERGGEADRPDEAQPAPPASSGSILSGPAGASPRKEPAPAATTAVSDSANGTCRKPSALSVSRSRPRSGRTSSHRWVALPAG